MNAVERETAEIKRLESVDEKSMTPAERIQHVQAIKDAYWRRRMATRTDDEIKKNVSAP